MRYRRKSRVHQNRGMALQELRQTSMAARHSYSVTPVWGNDVMCRFRLVLVVETSARNADMRLDDRKSNTCTDPFVRRCFAYVVGRARKTASDTDTTARSQSFARELRRQSPYLPPTREPLARTGRERDLVGSLAEQIRRNVAKRRRWLTARARCESTNQRRQQEEIRGTVPFSGSIEVSIPACHAGDPGSIPGRRVFAPARQRTCAYFDLPIKRIYPSG
jgi:hypothetical protein